MKKLLVKVSSLMVPAGENVEIFKFWSGDKASITVWRSVLPSNEQSFAITNYSLLKLKKDDLVLNCHGLTLSEFLTLNKIYRPLRTKCFSSQEIVLMDSAKEFHTNHLKTFDHHSDKPHPKRKKSMTKLLNVRFDLFPEYFWFLV